MMFLLKSLVLLNTFILRIGRHLAWIAIGLMVVIILVQVLNFRYGFEFSTSMALMRSLSAANRFFMLWMTGLIAPSAYRWGGFVSIEMLLRMFHPRAGAFISLLLLMISLMVLVIGLQFGWKHVNSGWLFASSSLKWPLHLIGMQATPIKLAWMYLSLPVGLGLMTLVNVELIIKQFYKTFGTLNGNCLVILINPFLRTTECSHFSFLSFCCS